MNRLTHKLTLFFLTLAISLPLFAQSTKTEHATADEYDWLIEGVKESPDAGASMTQGIINGEKYVSILSFRTKKDSTDYNPTIVILVSRNGKYERVAEVNLQQDNINAYTTSIKNNSIFIRNDTAHHGVYSSQYQFKKINDSFYLVGLEYQSMTPSIYSVSEEESNAPDYQEVEIWSGSSVNFFTSIMECWQQTFNVVTDEKSPDWKEYQSAHARFNKGQRATKGVTRQVSLPKRKLVPLDGFNLYPYDDFYDSSLCYFDYKNRFRGK